MLTVDEFVNIRKLLNITQEELAYELGLTQGAIAQKETGRRPITRLESHAMNWLLHKADSIELKYLQERAEVKMIARDYPGIYTSKKILELVRKKKEYST